MTTAVGAWLLVGQLLWLLTFILKHKRITSEMDEIRSKVYSIIGLRPSNVAIWVMMFFVCCLLWPVVLFGQIRMMFRGGEQ